MAVATPTLTKPHQIAVRLQCKCFDRPHRTGTWTAHGHGPFGHTNSWPPWPMTSDVSKSHDLILTLFLTLLFFDITFILKGNKWRPRMHRNAFFWRDRTSTSLIGRHLSAQIIPCFLGHLPDLSGQINDQKSRSGNYVFLPTKCLLPKLQDVLQGLNSYIHGFESRQATARSLRIGGDRSRLLQPLP